MRHFLKSYFPTPMTLWRWQLPFTTEPVDHNPFYSDGWEKSQRINRFRFLLIGIATLTIAIYIQGLSQTSLLYIDSTFRTLLPSANAVDAYTIIFSYIFPFIYKNINANLIAIVFLVALQLKQIIKAGNIDNLRVSLTTCRDIYRFAFFNIIKIYTVSWLIGNIVFGICFKHLGNSLFFSPGTRVVINNSFAMLFFDEINTYYFYSTLINLANAVFTIMICQIILIPTLLRRRMRPMGCVEGWFWISALGAFVYFLTNAITLIAKETILNTQLYRLPYTILVHIDLIINKAIYFILIALFMRFLINNSVDFIWDFWDENSNKMDGKFFESIFKKNAYRKRYLPQLTQRT